MKPTCPQRGSSELQILVSLDIDGQPVGRRKTETASDSAAVQIVDVVASDDVFAVAVTILCLKGDARGKQSRNDGAADRAFGDDLIIVADAEAGVAGEIIRRAARRYVDRAAGRIAPIKIGRAHV